MKAKLTDEQIQARIRILNMLKSAKKELSTFRSLIPASKGRSQKAA